MRRRSTLLPIAILAVATASAGPTTAPTAAPTTAPAVAAADPAKAGEQLCNELEQKYAVAAKDLGDPRSIETWSREEKVWHDLLQPLTTAQCDELIAYATVAKDGGPLAGFAVTRAVQDGNPDVLKKLLANVWVDTVDGRYTEWMLEKQTGRSVEILTAAYRATASHAQAEALAAVFRRSFSQVDGDHLTDDRYVDKCDGFRRAHTDLRLNDHYQLPPVMNPPAAPRPVAPDPDAGMLFRE